jgi:WG containing repeat
MCKKTVYFLVLLTQFNISYGQLNIKKTIDIGSEFIHGIAKVQQANRTYYIDVAGNFIFDEIYLNQTVVGKVDDAIKQSIYIESNHNQALPNKFFVKKNNKYGLINANLNYILTPQWDVIDLTYKDYVILKKGNQIIFADTNGNLLLPSLYDDAFVLDESNKFFAVKKSKWGIYDCENKSLMFDYQFDDIDYCGGCGSKPYYFLASKNKNWGVVAFNKKILAPFKYQHSHSSMRSDYWEASFSLKGQSILIDLINDKEFGPPLFNEPQVINYDIFTAINTDGKNFIVKRNGEKLPGIFDWLDYNFGFKYFASFKASVNGKLGVLDRMGTALTDFNYTDITIINDSLFAVKNKGKWGIANDKNKLEVPLLYNEVLMDYLPSIVLKKGANYFMFDVARLQLNNTPFESVEKMQDGNIPVLFVTELNGKKGIVGSDTKIILPNEYDKIEQMYRLNLLQVYKNNKTGIFNWSGKNIVTCEYDDIEYLQEFNLIKAKKNEQLFLYNYNGQKLFESAYTSIVPIDSNLFLLEQKSSLSFFLGKVNAPPIELKYQQVDIVGNSLTAKINDSAYILLDFSGKRMSNQTYTSIGNFENGFYMVKKNGKVGFLNSTGKELVPCKYDAATNFNNDVAKVIVLDSTIEYPFEDDSTFFRKILIYKYTFVNTQGKEILPYNYAYNYNFSESIIDSFLILTSFNKVGLANSTGKILVPTNYGSILINENKAGGFIAANKNKWYLYTAGGKLINTVGLDDIRYHVSYSYTSDTKINFEFPVLVKKEEHWVYINQNGAELPFTIKKVSR